MPVRVESETVQVERRSSPNNINNINTKESSSSDHDDEHHAKETDTISIFRLTLRGVTLELSSLGAKIAKLWVPGRHGVDNVVLGVDNNNNNNPAYFGVIVGRVANRIANGTLPIRQPLVVEEEPSCDTNNNNNNTFIQLERNNWPNHLHGGSGGFHSRNWQAKLINPTSSSRTTAVEFSLLSDDGDQGYPGAISVTATYSLVEAETTCSNNDASPLVASVQIKLSLQARLVLLEENNNNNMNQHIATPVNLSNHSYFNLNRHDSHDGILSHTLQLEADEYTPVDAVSIPTRQVLPVRNTNNNNDSSMDWRTPRTIREGLVAFAVAHADKTHDEALADVDRRTRRIAPALGGPKASPPNAPYGFDHNYVVRRRPLPCSSSSTPNDSSSSSVDKEDAANRSAADDDHKNKLRPLVPVGTLRDPKTQRQLTVHSTAPGVQLYTANYLDGTNTGINNCDYDDDDGYRQWQALCLETQNYPDSIHVDNNNNAQHAKFSLGQCDILTTDNPTYRQEIEYHLEYPYYQKIVISESNETEQDDFVGSDTEGNIYTSLSSMWRSQGVYSKATAATEWYERAADYYEANCPPTLDGVLGGFASITDLDLKGSRRFVTEIQRIGCVDFTLGDSCECGAGIGRVTKGLLADLVDSSINTCDLVESSPDLLAAAPEYLGATLAARCRFYCEGLQHWTPSSSLSDTATNQKASDETTKYSIIWIQWVFCYLTDDDAVALLQRCGASLLPGGVICLKENVCDDQDFVVDTQDASLSRSIRYLHWLAGRAGLQFVHAGLQDDFPDQIFPVYQLALRQPKSGV